jgi:transposase
MNDKAKSVERVIGLDAHPDSFTAAILRGSTPAAAVVEKVFHKVPMAQLTAWAQKHTTVQDLIALEASGNSFQVARRLAAIGRGAKVLESCQMGKLKEAHANNDKISAVRIGKAYLAGTAKEVWVPDLQTQERRDWFHAYTKAVKRTPQMRARLRSYLSDNGVRLKPGTALTEPELAEAQLRPARTWSGRQWQVIEIYLADLRHADQQRRHGHQLIAQEVLGQPEILSLVRLCGVREIVAFAVAAFVGDVRRFARPQSLVKYAGLNPAFDDSGASEWSGGIGGHGHKLLRSLLIEGAQAILRSGKTPLARWGRKLQAAKGSLNLAVAAVARKLTVALWYLMMGRWTALEQLEASLRRKVSFMIGAVGPTGLKALGKTRQAYREEIYQRLKTGRTYVLDPNKKYAPQPAASPA